MTDKARAGMARVLSLELALLAAEVELLEELIAKGILPPGARRTPTAPELRAGVRFAELDRIVTEAAALLARKADRVRDKVLDGLAEGLAARIGDADPWAALEELARLTDPTDAAAIAGLADTIAAVEDEVADDLVATARAGHAEAIEEARRQGLPDRLLPVDVDPVDESVRAAARAQAKTVAQAPASRLLDVAATAGSTAATRPGATGGSVLEAALDAAEGASRKGTEDAARQAANVTHGLGRAAAQAAMPQPREVYASELLDRNTCGPCATVDGRTYVNLDAGLVDYPGAGGYVGCDGGSRCRGTLVLVHATEAPPTLDNPGRGPAAPGGPADRTPQGPSMPPQPPPAVALDPDPGVPRQLADTPGINAPDVDAQGRTSIPAQDLDEPITTVAPSDVDRDPELARYRDDELDALMLDPAETYERKLMAADELDQRAAGTRAQVWEEEALDAATLARYEAEREAWEKAGGYAADAVLDNAIAAKGGRRIDAVRQAWAEELEQAYIRAEDATVGYMIRKERLAEFTAKYGNSPAVLFEGPARTAYYYASRELRDYWADNPRLTFSEFAVDRGITDAKTMKRAQTAKSARDDAALWGDESTAGRAKRRAEQARKRGNRPISAGDRLVLEQKRRDRLAAQERKAIARGERDLVDVEPTPAPAPVVPEPVAPPTPPAAAPPTAEPATASRFTPEELRDALSPDRKRSKAAILKDLEATPDGRDLAATIKQFTETRGGVANLRKNIAATLDGTASEAVQARTRAFLDAVNTYPVDEVPALFRGIAVKVEEDSAAWWDAFEAQFRPGSTLDLNASSFTSSEKKAAQFSGMIGGTKRANSSYTAVRFILEGDAHALPVERLSKFGAAEKEWIAGGQFEVLEFTPGTPAQPYARVVIRQIASLADDQQ